MMCAYGLDVLSPQLSLRRLWLLAHRLPSWARTLGEPWGTEADLLALVVDHLAQLTWVTLKAAGAKSVSRPRPLPRPSDARARRAALSATRTAPRGSGSGGSWADAFAQLAQIPGVGVTHE